MNKEFEITADGNTIFIKGLMNKIYHRIHTLDIKDVIVYKVVINRDVSDLHTDYSISESDTFYRMIITSRNYKDDIELIYNERNNIINDESMILSEVNRVTYKPIDTSLYDINDLKD